jgi:hypothetical protein
MTRTEWFRLRARDLYHEEGEIEIDDQATVSVADPTEGAYVQAWVWVPTLGNKNSPRESRRGSLITG